MLMLVNFVMAEAFSLPLPAPLLKGVLCMLRVPQFTICIQVWSCKNTNSICDRHWLVAMFNAWSLHCHRLLHIARPCSMCTDCNLCFATGDKHPVESYPSLDYPTYDPNYHQQSWSHKPLPQGALSPSPHTHKSRHHHIANSVFEQQQKDSHLVPVGVGSHGWRKHTRKVGLVCSFFCRQPMGTYHCSEPMGVFLHQKALAVMIAQGHLSVDTSAAKLRDPHHVRTSTVRPEETMLLRLLSLCL